MCFHGVFTEGSPDIYSWLNLFFALPLCQKTGAYCCSLTQMISLYWLYWRPSSKGPLGGGPARSRVPPSSWQRWPESNPEALGPLGPAVRQRRPMWVDASCIIDKVCLGELEWVFAVRVRRCRRRQAHKLKAKAWHVVCVAAQTQADSVIHLSFEARVVTT